MPEPVYDDGLCNVSLETEQIEIYILVNSVVHWNCIGLAT